MTSIGTCRPLIGDSRDISILIRGRHYKIPERAARRLRDGKPETEIYHLKTNQLAGSIRLMRKDFYRIKVGLEPACTHRNRFNLLVDGAYWFSPVFDWCREMTS